MIHNTECENAKPTEAMIRIICGAWVSKAIHVVVTLGIPDILGDGRKSCSELAVATGTQVSFLRRLMWALTIEGVFATEDQLTFELTAIGATLRCDAPESLREWALLMLGDVHQGAWGELLYSVQTGKSAFSRRHGRDLWAFCKDNPDHAAMFDNAMAGFTRTYIANVLATFSFSGMRRIIDVAGGDGSLIIGLLEANALAHGVVFELPHVAKTAAYRIVAAGLTDRCVSIAGDALVEVPSGGDAYILSRVLHDWGDEASRRILKNCRNVLSGGARLLVIERIVPATSDEIAAMRGEILSDIALTDLNMMVMTSGRERTLAEYQRLFTQAGLRLIRVVPTHTSISVIELESAG
jgi:hypothetical protein